MATNQSSQSSGRLLRGRFPRPWRSRFIQPKNMWLWRSDKEIYIVAEKLAGWWPRSAVSADTKLLARFPGRAMENSWFSSSRFVVGTAEDSRRARRLRDHGHRHGRGAHRARSRCGGFASQARNTRLIPRVTLTPAGDCAMVCRNTTACKFSKRTRQSSNC